MDTLKGFRARGLGNRHAITDNGMPQPAEVWSKPDQRTGQFNCAVSPRARAWATPTFRTISGDAGSGGVRTDFYELYWADLSARLDFGTALGPGSRAFDAQSVHTSAAFRFAFGVGFLLDRFACDR